MGIPHLYECLYQCATLPIVKNNHFAGDQQELVLYLDTVQ
jgi:hypothetical protein